MNKRIIKKLKARLLQGLYLEPNDPFTWRKAEIWAGLFLRLRKIRVRNVSSITTYEDIYANRIRLKIDYGKRKTRIITIGPEDAMRDKDIRNFWTRIMGITNENYN